MSVGAIVDWREELAEMVRGLNEGDWDHVALFNAQGQACFRIRFKEICLTIAELTPESARALVGKVNHAEVAGVPAGHLLVKSVCWSEPACPGRLLLLVNQQPWNTTYNPAEGTLVDFRDASGQLVYQEADFGVIR